MNGGDIKRVEEVFTAKLEPLTEAVGKTGEIVAAHSERIKGLETKFENVGNCSEHAIKVEKVEIDIEKVDGRVDKLNGRFIALLIGIPTLLVALVAALIYFGG